MSISKVIFCGIAQPSFAIPADKTNAIRSAVRKALKAPHESLKVSGKNAVIINGLPALKDAQQANAVKTVEQALFAAGIEVAFPAKGQRVGSTAAPKKAAKKAPKKAAKVVVTAPKDETVAEFSQLSAVMKAHMQGQNSVLAAMQEANTALIAALEVA